MLEITAGVVLGVFAFVASGLALSGLVALLEKIPAATRDTARAGGFAQAASAVPEARRQSILERIAYSAGASPIRSR